MSIEDAVVSLIGGLGTSASTRVYREHVAVEPELPIIVVTRVGGIPVKTMGGGAPLDRASIRVEVLSDDLSSVQSTADAVRAGLDGYAGTVSGVEILKTALQSTSEGSAVDGDKVIRVIQQDYQFLFR